MLSSAVVETIIGLAFIYFLFAILCTALVEFVATRAKKRAKYLLRGLKDLLDDEGQSPSTGRRIASPNTIRAAVASEKNLYREALTAPRPEPVPEAAPGPAPQPAPGSPQSWATRLMGHSLVRVYKHTRANGEVTTNPSYLPAATFSRALLDLIVGDSTGRMTIDQVRSRVEASAVMPFKESMLALLKNAGDDLNEFRTALETWYDAKMAQITGAYKRWAKRWAIVIGLAVAVFLNVDSVAIALSLHQDGPLRAAVVAAATNGTLCEQSDDFDDTKECVDENLDALQAKGLPIGWELYRDLAGQLPQDFWPWVVKVLGLLITAGAASFGAPFWFDALNRVASLRNTGEKPKSTAS